MTETDGGDARPAGELATVHQLPVPVRDTPPTVDDGEVCDGEIMEDEHPIYGGLDLTKQRDLAIARRRGYASDARTVVHVVRVGFTHRHTKRGAKAFGRHLGYFLAGLRKIGRHIWEARTFTFYREQMTLLSKAHKHEESLEWEGRLQAAKKARLDRLIALINAIPKLLKAIVAVAIAVPAGLIALGFVLMAADHHHAWSDVLGPVSAVADVISLVTIVIGVAWGPLILAAPYLLVLLIWHIGRRSSVAPAWLAPEVDDGGHEPRAILPTTGAILEALRHLPLQALKQAFKDGWGSPGWPTQIWLSDPHIDGKGWRTQIILPQGVPVADIAKERIREILAHNLVRLPVEVWPTQPKTNPGVMDLWVADQGFLTGPVPAYPLLAKLDTIQTDYWKGVPAGVNIRGDNVNGRLNEANYAAGGEPGSGKSTSAINLVAGTILDPLARVDVIVCAENYDYEPMRPRLTTLETGIGQEVIDAAIRVLKEAYLSLERRGKALKDERINVEGSRSLTRAMAERDPGCHPWVVVLDEIQRLLLDEKYGEEALDILIQLISAARKYAITLVMLTPEPTKGSLPRKIMTVVSHKLCYAIGDATANDAVLGTGSYKKGISAVGLEPKTDESLGDVGTAMVRGFYPKPGLLRSYYLTPEDLKRITARALQLREAHGRANGTGLGTELYEERDLLTDVAEVMDGAPRVRSSAILRWLIERWPGTYDKDDDKWSSQRLAAALREAMDAEEPIHKGRVQGEGGQQYVALDEVLDVLDRRTAEQADDVETEQADEDEEEDD